MTPVERIAKARAAMDAGITPLPWMAEKAWAHANDETVHWSIRTVEKMPDTPWSPRYIAWMTGALLNGIGASHVPYKFCESCQHGYFKRREVAIEVRVDPLVETDVSAIVAVMNAAPDLFALIDEQAARITALESAWHVETMAQKDATIAAQEQENDRLKARIAELTQETSS